jgi:hypothetical protein
MIKCNRDGEYIKIKKIVNREVKKNEERPIKRVENLKSVNLVKAVPKDKVNIKDRAKCQDNGFFRLAEELWKGALRA